MDAYSASCRTTYKAFHHGGTRAVKDIRWIVMHSTESRASARQIAKYFATAAAGGSAHLTVDNISCYRSLPNETVPWAAPGANTKGFHIEQCGFAAWTPAQWLSHKDMLGRAAYKTAWHCKVFKIPPRFVTAAGLRAGRRGITTHAEVSKAWPNDSGNHHDPGQSYPMTHFISLVKGYLAGFDV